MQSPMEELRDTFKQIWRTFPEDSIHYEAAINAALIRFELRMLQPEVHIRRPFFEEVRLRLSR